MNTTLYLDALRANFTNLNAKDFNFDATSWPSIVLTTLFVTFIVPAMFFKSKKWDARGKVYTLYLMQCFSF